MIDREKEKLVSELKELAWEHHAPIEDRLNACANHLRNEGELDRNDLTELKLMVMECAELSERIAGVIRALGVKEASYAI